MPTIRRIDRIIYYYIPLFIQDGKEVNRIRVESELRLEKCTKNNLVYEAKKENDPIGILYIKKKALESRPLTIKVSIDMN